jgi:hypothetical protein
MSRRKLKAALQSYLAAEDRPTPVSISAIMRAVRKALPELTLGDEALAAAIAKEIVATGVSVVFDGRPLKQSD